MMRNNNFAAFILSHGRAEKMYTFDTLRKAGYTGRIVIIVDDEDPQQNLYKEKFGENVYVFNKREAAQNVDPGDNFSERRGVIYARNACFDIAKKLGFTHFIELDDDYTRFNYKFDENLNFQERTIRDLDSIFDILLDFYNSIDCKSLALAQNGDYIGGKDSAIAKKIKLSRKCMNTFICSVNRPFKFYGRVNEDATAYVLNGGRGDLFFTLGTLAIIQNSTQANAGGMTELYLDSGTYVKSFYSVMYSPSCVKIAEVGTTQKRIHHRIRWKNAVPLIINEDFKK